MRARVEDRRCVRVRQARRLWPSVFPRNEPKMLFQIFEFC
ncbi:hypothetical protein COLSTE_00922 [Collinsella stercoris DSM 13279]|uniref:Uncharacterized protein n=1 Tax=Collinsella stercoris DSM 13279 TaxID=445975 RepID=B6GA29_9ACTN|nr:hypothetical protein COLSTE_00922 [Collinsella stercoris DSM 13279]